MFRILHSLTGPHETLQIDSESKTHITRLHSMVRDLSGACLSALAHHGEDWLKTPFKRVMEPVE